MTADSNSPERPETLDQLSDFVRLVVTKFRNERRSDVELLSRFVESGDPEAFQAIVGRHGRSVWATCLALLGDPHDAEDAFQAAFMTLARRAKTVDARRGIGPWVRGVARTAASKIRRGAYRLNRLRDKLAADPSVGLPTEAPVVDESNTWTVAAEELERLPQKFREAVVMYHLEGRTFTQIAELMGCSVTAAYQRVNRGLELLRTRLSARGVALTAGILAAIPAGLVANTATAATAFARGLPLPSERVSALTNAIMAPRLSSWWFAVGATLLLAVGTAVALVTYSAQKAERPSLPVANSAVSSAAPADASVGPELAPAPRPSSRVFRHDGAVTALVVSPDGKRVASAGADLVIRVWDSATGKQVTRFDAPPEGVTALAFSPDGSALVAEDPKIGLAFWDLASGKSRENWPGHATGVEAMAFSSDGKRMVTIGRGGELHSLDLTRSGENQLDREMRTKQTMAKFLTRTSPTTKKTAEWEGAIYAAAFASDGRSVRVIDIKLVLWQKHIRSKVEVCCLGDELKERFVQPATAVAISANCSWAAWGNGDNRVGIIDLTRPGTFPVGILAGHKAAVVALAFTPNGHSLASVDKDGSLIRWTLPAPGEKLDSLKSNVQFRARVLAFSSDGKRVYGADANGEVCCWDAATLDLIKPIPAK